LKGAFAQFSYLEGQWQIVNFGRLSDAYGFDGNDFERKDQAYGENMIINGGFDVWQRGEIFSAGTARYTADRWTANATTRVDKIPFVPNGEGLALSAQFLMSPGNVFLIRHGIELQSANDNKPAPIKHNTDYTISGWVYMISADTLTFRAAYADDALNFSNAQDVVAGGTVLASVSAGAWEKFSYTFNSGTVNPLVSNVCFALSFNNNVLDNQSYLTGMKLEEGSTATPFTRAGNNIAGELAMCQRYYEYGQNRGDWFVQNAGNYSMSPQYLVEKRIVPALTTTNVSVAAMNPAINTFTETTRGFALYHGATATANGNFVDNWTADAEL
jgi:hypothetical protein